MPKKRNLKWDLVTNFTVVDPKEKAGEWRSAEDPSPYINMDNVRQSLGWLVDGDAIVIRRKRIRVWYHHYMDTTGPSALEQEIGGWVFEVVAPAGRRTFSRAAIARAISARYKKIYREEERTASGPPAPNKNPRLMNRGPTDGKYGIYGHVLGDLDMTGVYYNKKHDIYTFHVDS
jgi:hypothetical protein